MQMKRIAAAIAASPAAATVASATAATRHGNSWQFALHLARSSLVARRWLPQIVAQNVAYGWLPDWVTGSSHELKSTGAQQNMRVLLLLLLLVLLVLLLSFLWLLLLCTSENASLVQEADNATTQHWNNQLQNGNSTRPGKPSGRATERLRDREEGGERKGAGQSRERWLRCVGLGNVAEDWG